MVAWLIGILVQPLLIRVNRYAFGAPEMARGRLQLAALGSPGDDLYLVALH